jgi:predicted GNAT family acetyltransferase
MKQGGKGMFRKLKEADRKELQTLVSKEPELNLFIIGDLESYGFEESFLDY